MSNPQLVPFHLCFFLLILFMFVSVCWYANYESIFEGDLFHRASGTPWGVGFLLVLLFFMISYQFAFQERWFPLLSR
ncbi:hypothetical protein NMG60_11023295 [Bertholletia excelsa]